MNSTLLKLAVICCVLSMSFEALAQSDVALATRTAKLQKLSENLKKRDQNDRREAKDFAGRVGIPVRRELPNGRVLELQRIAPGIGPVFYITNNVDAADTVSTDEVWPGGSAGLDLDGSGMTVGEWDGGAIYAEHPDFIGRLTQVDGATVVSNHSTHVAGTLIGSGEGLLAESRGMAYAAHLNAYDWNSDTSEMALAASNGQLVSNHSYGIAAGWLYTGDPTPPDTWWWIGGADPLDVEDPNFGYYDSETQLWDQIAVDAPYYLIVKAAGNDRSDVGPVPGEEYTVIDQDGNFLFTSTLPRDADCAPAGYDCMPGASVAKNVLTVGAVDDLIGGYSPFSGPSSVQMTDFSGWGPTDDGRIKPDVVGNGVFLLSAWGDYPFYAAAAGTSMSAPNVTGSLLLLQEHYNPSPTAIGYAPDMMDFDGSTGYYSKTSLATSGNKVTVIARFKRANIPGSELEWLARVDGGASNFQRIQIIAGGSTFSGNTNFQDRVQMVVKNSAGTVICRLISAPGSWLDGSLHTMFAAFDGDAGTAIFYIDGVNADDTGNGSRVAPTTGTLETSVGSGRILVGAQSGPTNYFDGELGYFGYREAYLTIWSDFMDNQGNPKELDESGWTEWGAQPSFWNADGDMEVNAGSAGNMTKNGTITPVVYTPPYTTDNFMRAATIKALAIHTADEAGSADGPDYAFGWGLLNTKSAAKVITDNGGAHQIIEDSLLNGAVDSVEIFVTEADTRITATLVWTDPPGTPVAPTLDPPDLMLVNDLDLRIKRGPSTYMPWVLNPASPAAAATTGDNFRDNVEQVVIGGAGVASYFVEVSHKGTLLNGDAQNYSLIISMEPSPPIGSTLLIDEDFSGGLPAGWSIDTTRGVSWTINTPVPGNSRLDNQTGGVGKFAMVDNNYARTLTTLRTLTFDLSSATAAVLRFKSYFLFDTLESINVDLSTNGGVGWTNVWQFLGFNPFPTTYVLDLSGAAAGQSSVMLRFRYDSGGDSQGNLWQIDDVELEAFGAGPPPGNPPGIATNPFPASGGSGLGINTDLLWSAGTLATSHDVYFGTGSPLGAPDLQGNQGSASFDPGTLTYSTTYNWRIDEVNTDGTTQGNTWSFTTEAAPAVPPGQATNPSPVNGGSGLGIDANLSWSAGTLATSHDVYFGTSSSLGAPDLQGNQAGTSFDPGTLTYAVTYYWRIDEVNADGTTQGITWSFTTEAAPPPPPPPPQTIHLAGLSGGMSPGSRGSWTATVEISVEDQADSLADGVTVEGTWSNGSSGGATCLTTGGICSVEKVNLKSRVSSVQFTVTNLIKTGSTYTPADNVGGVSITVSQSSADLTPSAANDSYQTDVGVSVNGNVISNDNQGDAPASINANTQPSNGSLSMASNGAFTYTPNALFEGPDSFTYRIVDQDGDISNTATVDITVNGAEPPPPPPPGGLSVSLRSFKVKGIQHVEVTWQNFAGALVAISRDSAPIFGSPTANDGLHDDNIGVKGSGQTYTYQVCETGTSNCASASTGF